MIIFKVKRKNNVWYFLFQRAAFSYKQEKLQDHRWSSPTMPEQQNLPLLPTAITAMISLPNLWALLHTPPTPKSPKSKEHPKLLCSLTAALHGAIYKPTLKSPPTPPSFPFLSFTHKMLPQIPLIHSLYFLTVSKDMDTEGDIIRHERTWGSNWPKQFGNHHWDIVHIPGVFSTGADPNPKIFSALNF